MIVGFFKGKTVAVRSTTHPKRRETRARFQAAALPRAEYGPRRNITAGRLCVAGLLPPRSRIASVLNRLHPRHGGPGSKDGGGGGASNRRTDRVAIRLVWWAAHALRSRQRCRRAPAGGHHQAAAASGRRRLVELSEIRRRAGACVLVLHRRVMRPVVGNALSSRVNA